MASMEEYRSALARRYWHYLQSRFPDWQQLCDLRRTVPGRRPVFLFAEAWRNVIVSPSAGAQEERALLALIPTGDRHVWFRSFNSSQALAQSLLGNLALYGCLPLLAELQTDEGEAFFGEAEVSSENFPMEFKVGYLNEPRPTKLDASTTGGMSRRSSGGGATPTSSSTKLEKRRTVWTSRPPARQAPSRP